MASCHEVTGLDLRHDFEPCESPRGDVSGGWCDGKYGTPHVQLV